MFQNISCILDDAISVDHLPENLLKPFREFVVDPKSVVRRHFDSYVRGSNRPPIPYPISQPAPAAPKRRAIVATPMVTLPNRPATYASTVSSAPAIKQAQKPAAATQRHNPPKKQEAPSSSTNIRAPIDNRLLVRVASGHASLNMSPYAIMQQLNMFLKENLVREVQMTKTGFAICPTSLTAQESLTSTLR